MRTARLPRFALVSALLAAALGAGTLACRAPQRGTEYLLVQGDALSIVTTSEASSGLRVHSVTTTPTTVYRLASSKGRLVTGAPEPTSTQVIGTPKSRSLAGGTEMVTTRIEMGGDCTILAYASGESVSAQLEQGAQYDVVVKGYSASTSSVTVEVIDVATSTVVLTAVVRIEGYNAAVGFLAAEIVDLGGGYYQLVIYFRRTVVVLDFTC